MGRFYVIADGIGIRFVPALPEKGALHLAHDLVELVYERAVVVSEDGQVRYLVERQYQN